MVTKDRIGAGLAIVAAIIGLVLVFGYRDAGAAAGDDDDDDGPANAPTTSQVVPAPGQQAPGQVPGQVQTPAPGQVQQPPAGQQPDNDGDDDDDG